jgi:hypothetical protein
VDYLCSIEIAVFEFWLVPLSRMLKFSRTVCELTEIVAQ